jgi:hypothetical protein
MVSHAGSNTRRIGPGWRLRTMLAHRFRRLQVSTGALKNHRSATDLRSYSRPIRPCRTEWRRSRVRTSLVLNGCRSWFGMFCERGRCRDMACIGADLAGMMLAVDLSSCARIGRAKRPSPHKANFHISVDDWRLGLWRIRTRTKIRPPRTASATGARRSTHVSVLLLASPGGRTSISWIRDRPLRLGNR